MLNLMEDERNKQISEEKMYQAEESEKPVENVYKPRSLIFERQPTRYAWFELDHSDDLKERDGIWKKTTKHNKSAQNICGTQTSGDAPVKTFKRPYNTNSFPQNKIPDDDSVINITCAKQRTRKRSIQKTNESGLRYRNKRIHLKEENLAAKVVPGQEGNCQDRNEIMKDEVTPYQVAKTTAEDSLKVEDTMEHRKSPPLSRKYLDQINMTNPITPAEQYAEAHVLGAKSSESSDKPSESKHDIAKQDGMKLCTSPEPVGMNNFCMNVADTTPLEKSDRIVSPESQCLETNKEKDKNLIINDAMENRIFGTTSDNLTAVNTEAVKFSFGSGITENPYKEAIVFSARDRQKNQNEADILKQDTLKLRKFEETTHRNINDVNECKDRVQVIGENVVSNEYPYQEKKDDVHIKQNYSTEDHSQSIKQLRKDKFSIQRQNDVTMGPVVEKEQTKDSEKQNISNEKDMTILSVNSDTDVENTETICKTCLALQEAEKFNYKSFSVVIDTLTDVNQKPSKGDFSYNEKQDVTKADSQTFADECGKAEPQHFTDTQHKINDVSEIEKCASPEQSVGLETTKTEHLPPASTIVSSSADKNVDVEHTEPSNIKNKLPAQHSSVEPKPSVSSEDSQAIENDSAESLETTKIKKHKHGWFTRLFSRLHKRKLKKVIECDIVSTPSKSCS